MKLSAQTKIGLILFLLILFFVVLNITNFSKNIKNFFYFISMPIQGVFWQAGEEVSDFFGTIFNITRIKEENENFKLQIQELRAKIARLNITEKENAILRQALNIGLEKKFKMFFGQIISKDITEDSILINKGLRDGVLEGMAVITEQKILIGKVNQVYDNFSRIMLVSNKESIIPVNIQRQKELLPDIEAIAIGKNNFQIKLDRILLEAEIQEGDKVVTSGLGGIFPSGILIGYIKNIERLGVETFQRAEIQPAIDIRNIRNIFLIVDF